jgi:hypothetical protein
MLIKEKIAQSVARQAYGTLRPVNAYQTRMRSMIQIFSAVLRAAGRTVDTDSKAAVCRLAGIAVKPFT